MSGYQCSYQSGRKVNEFGRYMSLAKFNDHYLRKVWLTWTQSSQGFRSEVILPGKSPGTVESPAENQ